MDTSSALETLAKHLAQGLEGDFIVKPVTQLGFVAILSPTFGVASLVPTSDPAEAVAGAERLAAIARGTGLEIAPLPFGVFPGASAPPVIVREHFLALDILKTMQQAAGEKSGRGAEAVSKITAALDTLPKPAVIRPISPNILIVGETLVKKVLRDEQAWLYGIDIRAKDIISPNYLLPALLVVAALRWAPPVVAAGKHGGFTVTLAPNPKGAVLGYSVTGVDISNPVLFFLPIVDVLRRSFRGGECWVDGIVEQYAEYMKSRGQNGDLQDLEVRVVIGGS